MLRTGELDWAELWAVVANLPPDSAYQRSVAGHPWRLSDVLLTSIVNLLRIMSWQWGGKGRAPEPIYLPGTQPDGPEKKWAGKPRPIEEVKRLLGW